MRRFWWVFAIVFVCSAGIYTVGTGWISQWTVTADIRHARRQLEVEKVLADLERAQQALRVHRSRVMAFAFVFPRPDLAPTYGVYRQLELFKMMFRALAAGQSMDAAPTPQFMAATRRLKAYRVPSLSVMAPTPQKALGAVALITGLLTLLLMGVRFLSGE